MVYVMVEKSATNNIRVYEVWKTNHYSATFFSKLDFRIWGKYFIVPIDASCLAPFFKILVHPLCARGLEAPMNYML